MLPVLGGPGAGEVIGVATGSPELFFSGVWSRRRTRRALKSCVIRCLSPPLIRLLLLLLPTGVIYMLVVIDLMMILLWF